jgi:hypothetical protein
VAWRTLKGDSPRLASLYVPEVNATAAARTYRIGGIQPYVMLLVLAACAAFSPFALGHAISSRSWFELVWVAVVLWFWCATIWKAAYRIDVTNDTVEFRSILWRRRALLNQIQWIRHGSSGFAVVRFEGGTVLLYGAVEGWQDFVTRVKAANESAQVFRV